MINPEARTEESEGSITLYQNGFGGDVEFSVWQNVITIYADDTIEMVSISLNNAQARQLHEWLGKAIENRSRGFIESGT